MQHYKATHSSISSKSGNPSYIVKEPCDSSNEQKLHGFQVEIPSSYLVVVLFQNGRVSQLLLGFIALHWMREQWASSVTFGDFREIVVFLRYKLARLNSSTSDREKVPRLVMVWQGNQSPYICGPFLHSLALIWMPPTGVLISFFSTLNVAHPLLSKRHPHPNLFRRKGHQKRGKGIVLLSFYTNCKIGGQNNWLLPTNQREWESDQPWRTSRRTKKVTVSSSSYS